MSCLGVPINVERRDKSRLGVPINVERRDMSRLYKFMMGIITAGLGSFMLPRR